VTVALILGPLSAPTGRHPAISIRPVPALEPPTDDELARAGILPPSPLAEALPIQLPGPTAPRRKAGRVRPAAVAPPTEPSATSAADRAAGHSATAAAHRFLAACVEVIGGYRPPAHLRGLCAPEEFTAITLQLTGRHGSQLAGRSPLIPRPATGAPPRSPRGGQVAPASRVIVRRVVVCEPVPGVAEVAVVLGRRERSWAVALRLERRGQHWCCTYLRVI
jgi:Family of unknown function (DUF6459)